MLHIFGILLTRIVLSNTDILLVSNKIRWDRYSFIQLRDWLGKKPAYRKWTSLSFYKIQIDNPFYKADGSDKWTGKTPDKDIYTVLIGDQLINLSHGHIILVVLRTGVGGILRSFCLPLLHYYHITFVLSFKFTSLIVKHLFTNNSYTTKLRSKYTSRAGRPLTSIYR